MHSAYSVLSRVALSTAVHRRRHARHSRRTPHSRATLSLAPFGRKLRDRAGRGKRPASNPLNQWLYCKEDADARGLRTNKCGAASPDPSTPAAAAVVTSPIGINRAGAKTEGMRRPRAPARWFVCGDDPIPPRTALPDMPFSITCHKMRPTWASRVSLLKSYLCATPRVPRHGGWRS